MDSATQVARNFFSQIDTPKSEEILMVMDVYTMMRLIPFGKRMSNEAQEYAIECKLIGKELEANAVAKDVSVINKNLNAIDKAYKLAMN